MPYADLRPRDIPGSLIDDQALSLTDIFPTGYSAIDWVNVQGDEKVAVFGAGPVGMTAAKSAWLRGTARVVIIDMLQYRLNRAKKLANVETILWENDDDVK